MSDSLGGNAHASERRIFQSDHLAVWASFICGSGTIQKSVLHGRSLKGWSPSSHDDCIIFRERVTSDLASGRGADLALATSSILDYAASINFTTSVSRVSDIQTTPEALKQAERSRRLAVSEADKKYWRHLSQKLRRQWKGKRALAASRKKPKCTVSANSLTCNGVQTSDRAEWRQELQRHCERKYVDPATTSDKVRQFRAAGMEARASTHGNPRFTLHVTLAARARLGRGKAAGKDGLVAEMFLCLPMLVACDSHAVFATFHRQSVRRAAILEEFDDHISGQMQIPQIHGTI